MRRRNHISLIVRREKNSS